MVRSLGISSSGQVLLKAAFAGMPTERATTVAGRLGALRDAFFCDA
jgi:hypothetical protein